MFLNIKDNAFFVADAHYNDKNIEFLTFLQKLEKKEIYTSQLFLMGDIFDFLSSESFYFIKKNKKVIDLLNKLSSNLEIIYLEGNHDYNLKSLFPSIKIIRRKEQPIRLKYDDKYVELSHGDNFSAWHYNLYSLIIRNSTFLKFINFIDFNDFLSKKIYQFLITKNICSKMDNFDSFARKRLENYSSDIVVEGHYHQGKTLKTKNQTYVNIPSLCCAKKYYVLNKIFSGVEI